MFVLRCTDDDIVTPEDEQKLDDEADALLKELAESQAEVTRMLQLQHQQAAELGSLKDQLLGEVRYRCSTAK
jgi:enoyl-CoA hydratase/carnithine racemase